MDWTKLQEIANQSIPLAHCTFYFEFFARTVEFNWELDWYDVVSCALTEEVDQFWISDNSKMVEIALHGQAQVEFHVTDPDASEKKLQPIRLVADFFVNTIVERDGFDFLYQEESYEENMAINLPPKPDQCVVL